MKNENFYFKKFFRLSKGKIIITLLLILSIPLGYIGIPPFGWNQFIGDVYMPAPNPITMVPSYIISNMNIENTVTSSYQIYGFLIVLSLIYYYLISCLLVFIYQKFKEGKKK